MKGTKKMTATIVLQKLDKVKRELKLSLIQHRTSMDRVTMAIVLAQQLENEIIENDKAKR